MSNKDDFRRAMNRKMVPVLQKRDQRIAEMRTLYFDLATADKQKMRARLEAITENSKQGISYFAEAKILVRVDNETEFYVLPHVFLKAIIAWDNGEEFVSEALAF